MIRSIHMYSLLKLRETTPVFCWDFPVVFPQNSRVPSDPIQFRRSDAVIGEIKLLHRRKKMVTFQLDLGSSG